MSAKEWLVILSLVSFTATSLFASELNYDTAEILALQRSAELAELQAQGDSIQERSVAISQWADPKLMLGFMNVPVDSFDLDQEAMTQVQMGVSQTFPKGKSLTFNRIHQQHLGLAVQHQKKHMQRLIKRSLRMAWLDMVFWGKVRERTFRQRESFSELLNMTESMLSNNQAQQYDVVSAQLELHALDNRLLDIDKQLALAQAKISRLVGQHPNKLSVEYPTLPALHSYEAIQSSLDQHPILLADRATVDSAKAQIQLACEQFKPAVTAGLIYGWRQGRQLDQTKRPDFMSASVTLDLPVFPGNRQSRTLKASQHNWVASEERAVIDRQDLQLALEQYFVAWRDYHQKAQLYQDKLIPQAKQYVQAVLLSFRNNKTDFPTLARASIRELETSIEGLSIEIEQEKTKAHLLYLQGDDYAEK